MLAAAVGSESVAKKAGRPKSSERSDRTVRIENQLLGWAEMVAKDRGLSTSEYVCLVLRGPVGRDFAALVSKMQNEANKPAEGEPGA